MEISIELSDDTRQTMDALRDTFGPELTRINSDVARETCEYVKKWYREKGAGWFDGPNHAGTTRSYMRTIMTAWHAGDASADGFSVYFSAGGASFYGLRLHHLGGTITPKNALALTIPIIPEARGISAADYAEQFHELFVLNKDGDKSKGVLAQANEDGSVTAVYALRRSSYIPSLKERTGRDAIPTSGELVNFAEQRILDGIMRGFVGN